MELTVAYYQRTLQSGIRSEIWAMSSQPDNLIQSSGHNFSMDYSSQDIQLKIIGLGFVFYTFIFLLSHILSNLLFHTYRSLSAKEKVAVNMVDF